MKIISAIALGLLVAGTVQASAHNDRADRQADRIEAGRRDGSITWREGIKLRREQRDIQRVEKSLKSDGRYSRSDRKVVNGLQNQAGRSIYKERHDGWRRAWWAPRVGR